MSAVRKSCRVWKKVMKKKEAVETKVTLGGKFLDRILSPKSDRAYELSAVGQVEAGTNHILWTLRIGQINSQKYYVIRDIPLFLRVVEKRKSYMIGKIYEDVSVLGSL